MTGAALAARVSTARAVRVLGRGRRSASRSSTTAPSARSCAGSPRAGAAVTVFPHDVDADTLAAFDGVAALERPRRSRAARRRGRDGARAARPRAGARHLPRPPAARARDRPARPSSCRSATAARTTRCSSARRGRVLVTSQNHGFAVAPSADRAATHESLYDGTVEGLAYPELRARSVQFHPEAGPGPARRVAAPRRLGRGGAPCRGVTTSHSICLIGSGPDRDRPGLRVRLRRLPGAEGAARGRLPHDRRQLEPGDDHDRPRLRRPHLPRAARPRGRRRRASARAARRAAADDGRPDGAQPRARARRRRRARRARDRADRRRAST